MLRSGWCTLMATSRPSARVTRATQPTEVIQPRAATTGAPRWVTHHASTCAATSPASSVPNSSRSTTGPPRSLQLSQWSRIESASDIVGQAVGSW